MSHFIIRSPIWNGGRRCVGLAEGRLNQQDTYTTFDISYRNKKGERIYPHQFRVLTSTVLAGKRQLVGGCIWVRLVALADCTERSDVC